MCVFFFFSSRRRHTRFDCDWSSDVCSSDLGIPAAAELKIVELKVVAFFDAGRVFGPGEAVRLTTRGLHRSGGGQLALRFLRSSLLVVGYGRGSEGGEVVFRPPRGYLNAPRQHGEGLPPPAGPPCPPLPP